MRESEVQPLVVVFEDLHWIDGETQTFLDSLVESLPAARLLLLVNYRPEYRHAWGGKTYYRQLRIDPLPPESADELLDALLGPDAALGLLKQLLVERTEANPFFLEESVRALVETGALAGERGAYRLTRPVENLKIPATVQAILAARIDRLGPEAKRLLQAAAVIGKDVPMPLLLAIADAPEHEVRAELTHLQAAEFLYETRLFPDLEYTFKHALTHEVAYQGLFHERQRALHARRLPCGVPAFNVRGAGPMSLGIWQPARCSPQMLRSKASPRFYVIGPSKPRAFMPKSTSICSSRSPNRGRRRRHAERCCRSLSGRSPGSRFSIAGYRGYPS